MPQVAPPGTSSLTPWLYRFPGRRSVRSRSQASPTRRSLPTRITTTLNYPWGGMAPVSGRIAAFATHPTDSQTVYAGAAYGGIWKTTNGGATWSQVFDDAPAVSIGALASTRRARRPFTRARARRTLLVQRADAVPLGGVVPLDERRRELDEARRPRRRFRRLLLRRPDCQARRAADDPRRRARNRAPERRSADAARRVSTAPLTGVRTGFGRRQGMAARPTSPSTPRTRRSGTRPSRTAMGCTSRPIRG